MTLPGRALRALDRSQPFPSCAHGAKDACGAAPRSIRRAASSRALARPRPLPPEDRARGVFDRPRAVRARHGRSAGEVARAVVARRPSVTAGGARLGARLGTPGARGLAHPRRAGVGEHDRAAEGERARAPPLRVGAVGLARAALSDGNLAIGARTSAGPRERRRAAPVDDRARGRPGAPLADRDRVALELGSPPYSQESPEIEHAAPFGGGDAGHRCSLPLDDPPSNT